MTYPIPRYFFLALCLIYCTGAGADCPPSPSVREAIETGSPEVLLSVIRQVETCEGYQDSLGLAYHKLGVFYYFNQEMEQAERVAKALEATRKAIAVRSGMAPVPYADVGQSHLNMAFFHQDQLDYDQAVGAASDAMAAFERGGSSRVVNCLWKLADIMELIGDYRKALDYLELARNKAIQYRDTALLGDCYNLIGRTYNEQGRCQEALAPLNQAFALFSAPPPEQQSDYQLASVQLNLGNAYDHLGRYQEALDAYRSALNHAERHGDPDFAMQIRNNIGIPLKKLGRLDESEQVLREVLRYATAKGYQKDMAAANDNLGDLYMIRGDFLRALELYHRAILQTAPGFRDKSIEQNPDKEALKEAADKKRLLNFLNNKANAWKAFYESTREPGYLHNALQCYRRADEVAGLMRQEHSEQSSKLFWRYTTRPVYEQAIEACYLLGDAEQAFFFMEKSRAALLLDALLAGNARQAVPDSIARRELQLKRRLLAARESMENGGDAAQLLAAQDALERFVDELAENYPAYHGIRYNLKVSGTREVCSRLLDEETQLVEYFLAEDFIYLLSFSPRSAPRLVRAPRDEAFAGQLQQVLAYLSGAGDAGPEAYQAMAYPLYQRLLEPVYEAQCRKMLLIPDGELAFLPFDALPKSQKQPGSFGQVDYLIRDHNIYYAYSATVLSNLVLHGEAAGDLLQIAPGFEQGERGLPPLAHIERGMGGLGGYRLLSGDEATREQFLERASRAWLIHLTTHASTGTDEGDPRIEFIDQPLLLPELYAMELSAQLVVLDACQTNLGRIETGEGAMSLARGFAFAGASSLISSLWEVRDRYTAILFREFYQQLLAGRSKAEALRQAKLAYLGQAQTSAEKSPRHWAGFVYIGKDGAMELEQGSALFAMIRGNSWLWLGGLLLAVSLFIWGMGRRKARQAVGG